MVTLWLEATTPIPRVWVYANQIEDRGAAQAVNCAGGYLYVSAQKIFNTYGSASATAAAVGISLDATLWLDCDKIIGGVGGCIQHKSGTAWIRGGEIADNGTSTANLIESASNDLGNAGTLNIEALTITKTANGDLVKVNDSLNTINLLGGKLSVQSGYYDLNNAAGTLNLHGGGSGSASQGAYKISGTINRLGAGAYSQADLALLSQVFN